jgi:hypothetical protein
MLLPFTSVALDVLGKLFFSDVSHKVSFRMNFLPAIPLSSVLAIEGPGGAAVNKDGSLLALVDSTEHSVQIYSVDGTACTAAPVIVGTAGTAGCLNGQFRIPSSVCFAHRNGVDTLLTCDYGNDRVVEVTATGVFVRTIAVRKGSGPCGIAYCGTSDVIALSLNVAHAVVLLQYASGIAYCGTCDVIGSGGIGDGQLCYPRGVSFTADGRYILVADWGNDRVSKFSAASGEFIAHAVTNGISYPRDVLQCEDGSILVAQGNEYGDCSASVVCVGEDGVTLQDIIIPSTSCGAVSLSYSMSLNGVIVKMYEGGVFLLCDAWMASSRSAWLSALASY